MISQSFRVVLLSTGDATHQLLSWHAWIRLPLSHTAAGKCGRKMADVYGKVFPLTSEAAEQKKKTPGKIVSNGFIFHTLLFLQRLPLLRGETLKVS